MNHCELRNSCFFFNDQVMAVPQTRGYMRDQYCNGNYTQCARYKIARKCGTSEVPTYIYPDDLV